MVYLSFALALMSMLGIFADFGLNTLMTREIARNKSLTNKYLNNIFSIKLITNFYSIDFYCIDSEIFNYPNETVYVLYFMMIFLIFSTFSNFFASIFQSYEKLEYQSVASV